MRIRYDFDKTPHDMHLRSRRENRPSRDRAGEPRFAQSVGENARPGHASEKNHHVARSMARIAQFGEALDDTARFEARVTAALSMPRLAG